MRHISSTCGLRRKDVFVCWSDRLALLFVRIARLFSDRILLSSRLSIDVPSMRHGNEVTPFADVRLSGLRSTAKAMSYAAARADGGEARTPVLAAAASHAPADVLSSCWT
jgi:hypothetical protein